MPTGAVTFPSRIDRWYAALVFLATLIPLGTAAWLAWHGTARGVTLLVAWGITMPALTIMLGFPTRYTLEADALAIRSGWLKWTVPYPAIRSAIWTWAPLPGPAWSLRRLRLEFADGFILVSPDDRELFIEILAERCPHLTRVESGRALRLPLPHEKAAR